MKIIFINLVASCLCGKKTEKLCGLGASVVR